MADLAKARQAEMELRNEAQLKHSELTSIKAELEADRVSLRRVTEELGVASEKLRVAQEAQRALEEKYESERRAASPSE